MRIFRGGKTGIETEKKEKGENVRERSGETKENTKRHSITDREFEQRLFRARSEEFEIKWYDKEKEEAVILSVGSSNEYRVTKTSCNCQDAIKNGTPCKHMLYMTLKTGRYKQYEVAVPRFREAKNNDGEFVPVYSKYYSGGLTGIGYTNLYTYRVIGKVYGKSEKTGKQTERVKEVYVDAISEQDAREAAKDQGVMEPYKKIELIDEVPTEAQFRFLYGAGIPHPNFLTVDDISALLTRYQEENDEICTKKIFEIATENRVKVSYFDTPGNVINAIWTRANNEKKVTLFCYAVYCREYGYKFAQSPHEYSDTIFAEFLPTEKQKKYILGKCGYPSFVKRMDKGTQAYAAAKEHLKTKLGENYIKSYWS